MKNKIQNIFWFRSDLRLNDNLPLYESSNFKNVAAIYIYDTEAPCGDVWASGRRLAANAVANGTHNFFLYLAFCLYLFF